MTGVHWIVRTPDQLSHLVLQLREYALPFSLKVGPVVSPKTGQQIRYAHSLCNALASAKEVSPDIAKRDAKIEYGITVVHYNVITGRKSARLKSFADYSKQELSEFISAMEVYLSENGIPFHHCEDAA